LIVAQSDRVRAIVDSVDLDRPSARLASKRSPETPRLTGATLRHNQTAEQYAKGVGEIRLNAEIPPRRPGPRENSLRVEFRSSRNRNSRIVQQREERFNPSGGNDAT
jgi:hypothetical protein